VRLPETVPGTSVIICSRGRPELLGDVIQSALAMRPLPAELVVVDQSEEPHPGLSASLDSFGVDLRYLWRPDRGLSRARNQGVLAATGDVLAFLDDDLRIQRDWLGKAAEALEELGPFHVLTSQIRPGTPEVPGAWAPSTITDPERRSYSGRQDRDVLYPGCMVIRRSVFDEVGWFDESLGVGTDLPAAEDNDFAYRLLAHGYTIDYRPEMVVIHRAWRDEGAMRRLRFDYGRGQGAFYVKHLMLREWSMARRILLDVVRHLRRAVRRVASGDLARCRDDLEYVRGLGSGALARLRRR